MDQISRLDSVQFALNAFLMLIISFSAAIIGLVFLSFPHIEYYDDEAWLCSVIASVPSYCLIALAVSNMGYLRSGSRIWLASWGFWHAVAFTTIVIGNPNILLDIDHSLNHYLCDRCWGWPGDAKRFQEFLAIMGTPWILFASIVLRCRRLAAPRRVPGEAHPAQAWGPAPGRVGVEGRGESPVAWKQPPE
jgi:hypothetical protein